MSPTQIFANVAQETVKMTGTHGPDETATFAGMAGGPPPDPNPVIVLIDCRSKKE